MSDTTYTVTIDLGWGAAAKIEAAGIPSEMKDAEYGTGAMVTFETPGDALRAAAVLADDAVFYPYARRLAKVAAMVVPTRGNLDQYPPRSKETSSC